MTVEGGLNLIKTSEEVSANRTKSLRRMFIIAAIMCVTSIASIIVGSVAVNTSDGKFPFNAGGAIIAGVMGLFFSLCPMCMYCNVTSDEQPIDERDNGCCTMAMFIWGFFMLIGIPFGFAVNGVVAVIMCVHPTEESGCLKNTDTKMILAIITIILVLILMALSLMIFCICCRNICKDIKSIPQPSYSSNINSNYTRRDFASYRTNQYERRSYDVPNSSIGETGSSYGVFNIDGLIRPSAPPQNDVIEDVSGTFDFTGPRDINQTPGNTDDTNNPPGYTEYMNSTRGYPMRHETPPPSYHEAMESDPMETPL